VGEDVRVCGRDDVADGTARRFDVAGHQVALVRIGDDFYAIGDRCTHGNVSLSEGTVDPEDQTVECWKHGSSFSLMTGEPQSLPATKPEPVYDVQVRDGDVMIMFP
jgi:3-phenylpropionate/trans-cinnamate dioxygenase ferredoxin subunit